MDDRTVIVRLMGAADIGGAETLQAFLTSLSARRPARVVVDLSGLTLISSLSIGALVSYRHGQEAWHGKAAFAGVPVPIEQTLRRCRLDQIFAIVLSFEAALASGQSATFFQIFAAKAVGRIRSGINVM